MSANRGPDYRRSFSSGHLRKTAMTVAENTVRLAEGKPMDVLGWLWWGFGSLLGVVWGIVWFLIGGWVSTLAQIAVILAAISVMKFGWRRAPQEILTRASAFARFFWSWLRAREPAAGTQVEVREVYRTIRVKEAGDVNLSTLLTLLMLGGLWLLAIV